MDEWEMLSLLKQIKEKVLFEPTVMEQVDVVCLINKGIRNLKYGV